MTALIEKKTSRSKTFSNLYKVNDHQSVVAKSKSFLLPQLSDNKTTVVLDLDETLIHTHLQPFNVSSDHFTITIDGNDYLVSIRPHVRYFLKSLSKKYEVVLFTAGTERYANQIIEELERDENFFTHKLYQNSCKNKFGHLLKNASKLGRDLKKVVCVDDNHYAWKSTENLITCKRYNGGDEDSELIQILQKIEEITKGDDIRTRIRTTHKRVSY
ncbi:Mitochondrial import inner membrane translocase subunit TIM50 [Entamoeba marina]